MNPLKLMSPAGGLIYHYSALKYRKGWVPFVKEVNKWLLTWPVQNKKLCLIGPSGGYSLCEEFLSQFEEITCLDPDPLAPFIFSSRFPKIKTSWSNHDYFNFNTSRGLKTQHIEKLKQNFPDHALLFSNILGQISQISGKTTQHSLPTQIVDALSKVSWASYHDLYSFSLPTKKRSQKGASVKFVNGFHMQPKLQNDKTKGNHLETDPIQRILRSLWPENSAPSSLEVKDHQTHSLFDRPHSGYIIPWELRPNQIHLIEAIHQSNFQDHMTIPKVKTSTAFRALEK